MIEIGEIIRIKGDMAVIRIQRSSACRHCGACGFGSNPDEMKLVVPNILGAKPGDLVELSLESVQLLKASAITYLIPLFALIVGVIAGYVLSGYAAIDRQVGGAVLGIAFTALAFLGIRKLDPVFKRSDQFTPRMVAVINRRRKEN